MFLSQVSALRALAVCDSLICISKDFQVVQIVFPHRRLAFLCRLYMRKEEQMNKVNLSKHQNCHIHGLYLLLTQAVSCFFSHLLCKGKQSCTTVSLSIQKALFQ